MPYTVVPDKAAGDVFTAAMWNTYVAANINTGMVVQLADTLLGATAASITLSSIPQTFSHLRVVIYARGDQAAASNAFYMKVNGDGSANYDTQRLSASAASASASEAIGVTRAQVGSIPCATATANVFSGTVIEIPRYSQSDNMKAWVTSSSNKFGVASGNLEAISFAGFWRSVAAITSLSFEPFANNFIAGTRVTLYGMP